MLFVDGDGDLGGSDISDDPDITRYNKFKLKKHRQTLCPKSKCYIGKKVQWT